MKTTMIPAMMFAFLSAAASAALANGPMGNSTGSTWTTTGTRSRFVGIDGIVENSRRAADGLQGTDWWNRGVRGLYEGARESCGGARWDRRNSCQGAAEDRARVIADRLEQMRRNGELGGYTATVGSRNGYTVFGASFHTDTALQIRDPRGNIVGSYVIDNYVGRSLRGTTATRVSTGTVNFDPVYGNSNVVRSIATGGYRRR